MSLIKNQGFLTIASNFFVPKAHFLMLKIFLTFEIDISIILHIEQSASLDKKLRKTDCYYALKVKISLIITTTPAACVRAPIIPVTTAAATAATTSPIIVVAHY